MKQVQIMVKKYKKSIMILALVITIAVLLKLFLSTQDIDVSHKWERHMIVPKIQRSVSTLEIADINKDNHIDILFTTGYKEEERETDGVWCFIGPHWKLQRISSPDFLIRWSMAVASADIDNDGDLDVIALSFANSNVYLMVNPGENTKRFSEPWETIIICKSAGMHRDGERVELTDIDSDGFVDVVFPRGKWGEQTVIILFNPQGEYQREWIQKTIGEHGMYDGHDVLCSDIDQDNDIDVVFAGGSHGMKGALYWYENPFPNTKQADWKRHSVLTLKKVNTFGALQIDDVNNDTFPDVLVAEAHGNPGRLYYCENKVKETQAWQERIIGKHYYPHGSALIDIDNDGKNEYWVNDASFDFSKKYGQRKGGIAYYRHDTARNRWMKYIVAYAPEVARVAKTVDFDEDGDFDIITTGNHNITPKTNAIVWWENRENE